jgi:hypothetical protein
MHWDIRISLSAGISKSLECTECKISIGLRFSSFLSLIVFVQSTLDSQDHIDHMKIVVNNDLQGLQQNLKPTILSRYYWHEKNHTKKSVNNWTNTHNIIQIFIWNTNCSRTHTSKYYKKIHMKILVKDDDQGFHHQHP